MPELPEAETIARQLDNELRGLTLGKVVLTCQEIVHGDPRPLSKVLPGRRIEGVGRRAKRVIFELRPAAQLIFHLGMTGRLQLCHGRQPIQEHTHLRISIRRTRRELRFRDPRRFGGIWCLAGAHRHVGRKLSELGPEPLETTAKAFRGLLARSRQIKALLLDQRVIAGLGNIYCDEALHAARVHPLTKADTLDERQAGDLLRAIKNTLRKSIRFRGTTLLDYRDAGGQTGGFLKHLRVYQRDGQTCRRCGTSIERLVAAGRSTFICPACQTRKRPRVQA